MESVLQQPSFVFTWPNLRGVVAGAGLVILCGCTATTGEVSGQDGKLQSIIEPSLLAAAAAAESRYDYETAANSYRSLLQRHPDDGAMTLRLAQALRYSGKADQAIALLTPLAAERPEPAALIQLGKAHLAADHLDLALRYLDQARELAPGDWEAHSAIGVAYDYQGKFDKAEAAYREALRLSPDNPTVLNNLGLSQAQAGNLAAAVETLRKAANQPQSPAQIRQNLALVLALSGDAEGAERFARMDLPPAILRDNVAYYRSLADRY